MLLTKDNQSKNTFGKHVKDLYSYTLEELIENNYIPESFQKSEFLEVHSFVYCYGLDVK